MRRTARWILVGVSALLGACARTAAPPAIHAFAEREDGAAERAEYFLAKRLPPGETRLRAERWYAAEQRLRAMPRHLPERGVRGPLPHGRAGLVAAPQWEWLGPANVAGRTRSIAFRPGAPDTMLAGGVSGGVWISTDAGGSWSPLSDDAVNLNIGALLIDRVNPDRVWAGTGELYRNSGMPWSPMEGGGILVSSDVGQHFAPLTATQNDDFRYVADLVQSPHDPNRIYAATNSGVWRSDDGGASFVQLLRPADAAGGAQYEGCNDLALRTDTAGDWLLATCSSRSTADRYWLPGTVTPPACGGPCPAAIFLNTDAAGSGTWSPVLSEAGQGRTQMDVYAGDQNVMYAVAASILPGFDRNGDGAGDYDNALHGVFRSGDGGRTWTATLRNSTSDLLSASLFQFHFAVRPSLCGESDPPDFYGAGWYNNAIAIDPRDPQRVWVGGMTLFRSDDGGHTFGLASYYNRSDSTYVHPDMHVLRFHPDYDGATNQKLYAGNDGGIALTANARAAVSRGDAALCQPTPGAHVLWVERDRGMGTTQFYGGAVSADGHAYLAGAQDNGTWLGSDASGPYAWRHVYGGDGGIPQIDPRNASVLYATAQYLSLGKSYDGGTTFVDATKGFNDTTLFIVPYTMDPNAPDRLWGGGLRLWRTNDGAQNWTRASSMLGSGDFATRISAIAVAPGDSNRVLAGNQHGIFRNDHALAGNANTAWPQASPRTGWVADLAFDPLDSNVAYAVYSTFGGVHVWKSVDAGASWTPLDGSGDGALPDLPVHTIAVDPGDTRRLYVGTDLGLFVSIDGGAHWAVENTGFANVIVEDLVVNAPPGGTPQLFAFTYGRGVWRVPLSQLSGNADGRIDARTSGMWWNPAQNGHGLMLETIALGGVPQLVASWFVYRNGEPVWLTGVGPVQGNRATVPVTITSGTSFPPAFDAAAVKREAWGTLSFEFDTDHTGMLRWATQFPGYASGEVAIEQLARARLPADDPPGAGVRACHAGNWYAPAQSGHGYFLDVIEAAGQRQLLAVWYVYDQGKQLFLVGTGPIDGDHATVTLARSRGAQFPPAFQPGDVQREVWGTATFRFTDAAHARVDWAPALAGFAPGHLYVQRLTTQIGRGCN